MRDFDGDGDPDFAVSFVGNLNPADGSLSILVNDGTGAFTENVIIDTGKSFRSVIAQDLDGDSDIDVLTENANAMTITVQRNELVANSKFFVVDAIADRTFEYDAAGGAVEDYPLAPNNLVARGAASSADGLTIWVLNRSGRIFVYDNNGNLQGSWKAHGLSRPEGIATDGVDVWIVDRGLDEVLRYDGAASRLSGQATPDSTFPLITGNGNPRGITTDGSSRWVINNASTVDKVFKYTVSGTLEGRWRIDSANSLPTGITIDPTGGSDTIWIVDSGTDQVFEYESTVNRLSGRQDADRVFDLTAGNANPQGIADPRTGLRSSAESVTSETHDSPLDSVDLTKLGSMLSFQQAATQSLRIHNGVIDNSLPNGQQLTEELQIVRGHVNASGALKSNRLSTRGGDSLSKRSSGSASLTRAAATKASNDWALYVDAAFTDDVLGLAALLDR